MAIEFNLLYRWHGLIPTEFHVAGTDEPIWRTVFNRSGWPSTAWRGWSITPRAGAPADRAAQHRAALREVEHNSRLQGRA